MTHITKKELEKLQEELKDRLTVVRQKIAKRMKAAKEQGDLSENAEYSEVREDQWANDTRISELQDLISKAEVVEKKPGDKIDVGSKVHLKSGSGTEVFIIVTPEGVDLAKKMISNQSPIGLALLNKKTGQEVTIKTPRGLIKYKITKVE